MLSENHTLLSHPVDLRRPEFFLAQETEITVSQVVSQDINNIGLAAGSGN